MTKLSRLAVPFAAVAGALALSVAPVAAATMQAVYSGTVTAGYDSYNLFGLGNDADLTGLAYTATYIYDPNAGWRNTQDYGSVVIDQAVGYLPNPILSASIEIGGGSYTFSPSTFLPAAYNYGEATIGRYNIASADEYSYVMHQANFSLNETTNDVDGTLLSFLDSNYLRTQILTYLTAIPVDLDVPFNLALVGEEGYGSFGSYSYDQTCPPNSFCDIIYYRSAQATLNATSLTVSRFGVVPLPAGLPLLAAGLGALGVLRWRKATRAGGRAVQLAAA